MFRVKEPWQGGEDLNGDGDSEDDVLHLYNFETATTSNLEVAGHSLGFSGNWLAFGVVESDEGGRDLNGDGDSDDFVLHVHDLESGTTTNLELDVFDLESSGNWLVFWVDESSQGGEDLNGDGDLEDRNVLHVHDLETGTTTNLGLAAAGFARSISISDNWLVFGVVESNEGGRDLNGDGDAVDEVVYVHNLSTAETTNLGLAGYYLALSDNWLVFEVPEYGQGTVDLNGDGDSRDQVFHVYDLEGATTTNLELACREFEDHECFFSLSENWLVFWVAERNQGRVDLNGDGDTVDDVVHVHNLSTAETTNLGLAGVSLRRGSLLSGNRLAFYVPEHSQGEDLNGDGDSEDWVLHVRDLEGATTTHLGLAASQHTGISVADNWLVSRVPESDEGVRDLSRDGDAVDDVVHVHNLSTAETTNLGLAGYYLALSGNWLVLSVLESKQGGVDLNRDGDSKDQVVHLVDLSRPINGWQTAGDCNQDGTLDISDAICVFLVLFLEEPGTFPCGDGSSGHDDNLTLLDWQPDGDVDISDGISVLQHLFSGGPRHPLGGACVGITECADVCGR